MELFACYSSHDKARVNVVLNELRTRGNVIWDYNTDATYGNIPDFVSQRFEQSRVILLFLSENFSSSVFCLWEMKMACQAAYEQKKDVIPILLDEVPLNNALLTPLQRVELKDHGTMEALARRLVELVENGPGQKSAPPAPAMTAPRAGTPGTSAPARPLPQDSQALANLLLSAAKAGRWDQDLLDKGLAPAPTTARAQEEGLVLIKPGGTFHLNCLSHILQRLLGAGTIRQIRILNGPALARRGLFEMQYCAPSLIASGQMPLDEASRAELRKMYDVPAFKEDFGVPFEDVPLVPALKLAEAPYLLNPATINLIWERGRAPELWRNKRHNGMNKIGYQKTVFPFPPLSEKGRHPRLPCCIILNGFVPGLKHLFEREEAVTVALHVQTSRGGWENIRENVVGGDNDPMACRPGSIRHDAAQGRVHLELSDPVLAGEAEPVNGQRNVCHSSGNLMDGFRELSVWFDLKPEETLVGSLLNARGIPWSKGEFRDLEFLEFLNKSRLYELDKLLREGASIRASDILHDSEKPYVDARLGEIARECGVRVGALHANPQVLYLVKNGLRLHALGEQMFHGFVLEHLIGSRHFPLYRETLGTIRRKAGQRGVADNAEIMALAYMIAASDILFLTCRAYTQGRRGFDLFHNKVCASLPEQALDCAVRTWNNMKGEVRAGSHADPSSSAALGKRISDMPGWDDTSRVRVEAGVGGLPGEKHGAVLVLAGGRSTRTCSTIPKSILPLGGNLLIENIINSARAAAGREWEVFVACGFRQDLIESALTDPTLNFINDERLLGLGFRLLAALQALAAQGYDGKPVLITYTDMPNISRDALSRLIAAAPGQKDFAFLITHNQDCSGHVDWDENERPRAIIQKRLHPNLCHDGMPRDAGAYVFWNTAGMREAMSGIQNVNVKVEFTFADIVEILHRDASWRLVTVEESIANCTCVNTAADLLVHAMNIRKVGSLPVGPAAALAHYYGLQINGRLDDHYLPHLTRLHRGPFYFFDWWDRIWT